MQNNVEVLIKVIIPVILLIFWGLSSVFNREKTAKERAQGPAQRQNLYQTPRPAPQNAQSGSPNDEVLIIRGEPRRTPSRQPQPPKRNAGRGRVRGNGSAQAWQAPEAERSRNPSSNVSAELNQSLTRPLEMRPLSESMALSASASGTASISSSSKPETAASIDLRAALSDPTRIREAFVLNEVLLPPISMRARGRR